MTTSRSNAWLECKDLIVYMCIVSFEAESNPIHEKKTYVHSI